MENIVLKELIKAVNGKFITGDPNMPVTNVCIDSRILKKDDVFFAIKGKTFDGHNYIKEVVERRASAIVYSNENIDIPKKINNFPAIIKVDDSVTALGELAKYYRSKFPDIKIVGITGSNGKTTTKEILASILKEKDKTISNEGNFNNQIGLPLSILKMDSSCKYGVFEMGTSKKGEIKILSNILKPNGAVITNVGYSHLDSFESQNGVFEEKKEILNSIPGDGFIVLNNDDVFFKNIETGTLKKITFAISNNADVTAANISTHQEKQRFEMKTKRGNIFIDLPAKGNFNVLNALAASCAALELNFTLEEIKKGLESFTPPAMRMETFITKNGVIIINDAYNANPSSVMESIKEVCKMYPDKEVNMVLGDMLELGKNSQKYHELVGEFLNTQCVNKIYLIGTMSLYTGKTIKSKNVIYAKDQESLIKTLENAKVSDNSVYLFKASRGMKLEEISKKFFKNLEERKK